MLNPAAMKFTIGFRCLAIRARPILIALLILNVAATPLARADGGQSDSGQTDLGTVRDYMNDNGSDSSRYVLMPSHVALLGVDVVPAETKMATGGEILGLAVTSVESSGPAEDAGLRGARVNRGHVAAEIGVGIALVGAALFFPPALFGVAFIDQLGDAKKYDVIVAVDAQRTRSTFDLDTSLRSALPGEIIYVTVVRDGQRLQLRITAPNTGVPSATHQPSADHRDLQGRCSG